MTCDWRNLNNEQLHDLYSLPNTTRKGKCKVHPRSGHEVLDGEQRYISTLSLTSVLDGVAGQYHAPATLPPGK